MKILMTSEEYNTYEEMVKNGISDLVSLGFVCDTTESEVIIEEEVEDSIFTDDETEDSDNVIDNDVQETDETNEIDNVIEGETENGNKD